MKFSIGCLSAVLAPFVIIAGPATDRKLGPATNEPSAFPSESSLPSSVIFPSSVPSSSSVPTSMLMDPQVSCQSFVKTKREMSSAIVDANRRYLKNIANESNTFQRSYIAVTKSEDFVVVFPNGGSFENFLLEANTEHAPLNRNTQFPIQGLTTIQKGGIFGSSSIELVNIPEGVTFVNNVGGENIAQFAGNRQPRFTPDEDPFFFFHGQCVVNSGILEPAAVFTAPGFHELNVPQPVISSQSCKLNACLGGGGFNCIAIYSGTAFVFNLGNGIRLNNERTDPYSTGTVSTCAPPPLPPPFPGTIIGGTGSFEGIEGSVTIVTIAGTTGPLIGVSLGTTNLKISSPLGVIVQVISVKSNMPLPPGP